jgi:hypothetical protein
MSSNGQFAPNELALIPNNEDVETAGAQYVVAEALPHFLAAAREFREETGRKVFVKEGYRSLATQIAIFLARYFVAVIGVLWRGQRWQKRAGQATAAVPGTSRHGVAQALDIWSGIDSSFSSYFHLVWVRVAAKYGWRNTGVNFGEPWHQEWSAAWVTAAVPVAGPITITHPAAPISAPLTPEFQQEDDSMPAIITSSNPTRRSLAVGNVVVPITKDERDAVRVASGPDLQHIVLDSETHARLELLAALERRDLVIVYVRGSGYARLEHGKLTPIRSIQTLLALRKTNPPEITVTKAQFNIISKELS